MAVTYCSTHMHPTPSYTLQIKLTVSCVLLHGIKDIRCIVYALLCPVQILSGTCLCMTTSFCDTFQDTPRGICQTTVSTIASHTHTHTHTPPHTHTHPPPSTHTHPLPSQSGQPDYVTGQRQFPLWLARPHHQALGPPLPKLPGGHAPQRPSRRQL